MFQFSGFNRTWHHLWAQSLQLALWQLLTALQWTRSFQFLPTSYLNSLLSPQYLQLRLLQGDSSCICRGDALPRYGQWPRSCILTRMDWPLRNFRWDSDNFDCFLFHWNFIARCLSNPPFFWVFQTGVNKLADLVGVTLGPKGRNVVLESKYGSPRIVNDGVTVAKEVSLIWFFQMWVLFWFTIYSDWPIVHIEPAFWLTLKHLYVGPCHGWSIDKRKILLGLCVCCTCF